MRCLLASAKSKDSVAGMTSTFGAGPLLFSTMAAELEGEPLFCSSEPASGSFLEVETADFFFAGAGFASPSLSDFFRFKEGVGVDGVEILAPVASARVLARVVRPVEAILTTREMGGKVFESGSRGLIYSEPRREA